MKKASKIPSKKSIRKKHALCAVPLSDREDNWQIVLFPHFGYWTHTEELYIIIVWARRRRRRGGDRECVGNTLERKI